jgi:hypothetical protein
MRPRSGARYELERIGDDPVPEPGGKPEDNRASTVIYRGFVHLPDASIPVEVRLDLPAGEARASLGEVPAAGASTKDFERLAAAFVRSATKSAAASGWLLPRKIVRWRG